MVRHGLNYWTFEKCKEEALKYKTRSEFKKHSVYAYVLSVKNKWMDVICLHMVKIRKEKNHWIYENCHAEALKYSKRVDFQNGSSTAYSKALKNKWMDSICSHMIPYEKEDIYTKEYCQTEALKYSNRTDFKNNSNRAYNKSRFNNWIDEVCSHMKTYLWTYERCKNVSSEYKSKQEFRLHQNITYNVIVKNNWIELLDHLIDTHIPKDRLVYVYEFSDNSAYIGLTGDPKDRSCRHKRDTRSAIYKKLKTDVYVYINLTDYVDENEASVLENVYTEQYKNNGWKILNRAKPGSLGGSTFKWKNKELCQTEALKYSSRTQFQYGSKGAYKRSLLEGWLDEICTHMKPKPDIKPYEYWNYDTCYEVALKCKTKTDFKQKYITAYNMCVENNWQEVMCSHMSVVKVWDLTNLQKEALKYTNVSEFRTKSPNAYKKALKLGYLEMICSHIDHIFDWTKDMCQTEALKYSTKRDFERNSKIAFNKAISNKWLYDICLHMKGLTLSEYWNDYENCKIEALKYLSLTEFSEKSRGCYDSSHKNGWMIDICSHMKNKPKSKKK